MNRITFFLEGLIIYGRYFCLLALRAYTEEIREIQEASGALHDWTQEAKSYGWVSWD